MTFVTQPKTEGEKKDCPSCGKPIISRLKEYKDYPSKIQWQNEKETKAHYDKEGNCKGDIPTMEGQDEGNDIKNIERLEFTPTTKPSVQLLDDATIKIVKNEATLLYHVRKQVEIAIKEYEDDPHGGMIGQFTELIWKKYFGSKE